MAKACFALDPINESWRGINLFNDWIETHMEINSHFQPIFKCFNSIALRQNLLISFGDRRSLKSQACLA